MSSVEDNSNESVSPQVGTGPGERLQAARIKKGLSLEDVASRMHLSNSILEAIEENNFDEITAPIFVKGYLRAYARIVSLSEDEMIQQYIDFYSEEDPPISSTSNMSPELSVADARIKWTTYLVILVLAVLLGAWWWNKHQNEQETISLDSQSSVVEESAQTGQPVVDSDIQAGSENTMTDESVVESQSQQPVEASVETAAAEPQASVEEPPAAAPDAAGTVAQQASMPDQGSDLNGEAEAEPEPATGADTQAPASSQQISSQASTQALVPGTRELPSPVAPSGSDKLRIVVHADTWADVKDANNHQLLYDLLRADSVADLSGEAPFAVFLGNGHGVELLFNGDAIDFSSKIRNDNTSRLSIGE